MPKLGGLTIDLHILKTFNLRSESILWVEKFLTRSFLFLSERSIKCHLKSLKITTICMRIKELFRIYSFCE